MQKYYVAIGQCSTSPISGDHYSVYDAADADARIAFLEAELRATRKQNAEYSQQLYVIGNILGDWAIGKHSPQGKGDGQCVG